MKFIKKEIALRLRFIPVKQLTCNTDKCAYSEYRPLSNTGSTEWDASVVKHCPLFKCIICETKDLRCFIVDKA